MNPVESGLPPADHCPSSVTMKIRKALITAANPRQRTLPLQTLVDRDGESKSALQIILEEAASGGIEEFCIVVCPGDQVPYAGACGALRQHVRFIPQPEPRGYGHAVLCGRAGVGDEPFLHIVGDHLHVAHGSTGCARQILTVAEAENTPVSAVQPTRESLLTSYGTVGGRLVGGDQQLYQIEAVLEKPTPTLAEQQLIVPGLRAGFYLCFFGLHVLDGEIFAILDEQRAAAPDKSLGLSPALHALAAHRRYLALAVAGRRYDIGAPYGLLLAQLALSLAGRDRDQVLTHLVELLAVRTE
jgi:UTP--glucose-1-phosphate uridylyltransferase